LNVKGELELKGEYRYEHLERIAGAADLIGHFSGCLWRSPEAFEEPLPEDRAHLTARWRSCSPSAGLFSLRCRGELLSISLLAAGADPEAEAHAFEALQRHLLRELHDTGHEPAFALMDLLAERPVAATINFGAPAGGLAPPDRMAAALADRCFAASYFRFLGLA
jgi:hypothetical protein